jgi:Zn-dependent peptidase ImmA (M78 family)
MKNQPVEGVQPVLLSWARESIGFSVEDVAIKMKRSVDEILGWESGISAPSYSQLEKLAYQLYKRPLAVFFLPNPPNEVSPKKEFRSLPESDLDNLKPDTYMHVRKGHAYQISLKEVFNNSNPAESKLWQKVALNLDGSVADQSRKIRNALNISIENQSAIRSDEEALKTWRASIEEKGVFVFKESFKQKDISGFCLSDDEFPIIYLNNTTTKTRQIFSLFHELAHILLNTRSLSKFEHGYFNQLPPKAQRIEVFCNAIAAEVLIPKSDFETYTANLPFNIESVSDDEIERIAARYSVSRESILRRFLDQDRVSPAHYNAKSGMWANQRKGGSGGNWYATANAYLSSTFAREVLSQHYKHNLSIDKASDLLGIKAKNFSGLEQRILQGTSA